MMTSPLREKDQLESLRSQAQHVSASLDLRHSPATLWPLVSNTDMLNQQLGLSPTENSFRPTSYGGSQMSVETRAAGITMAYEEFPFEWQAPHFLAVERVFQQGAFKYLRFGIRLEALNQGGDGTRLSLLMDYVPNLPDPVVKDMLQLNLEQMLQVFEGYDHKLSQGARGIQVFFADSGKGQAPKLEAIEQLTGKWQSLAPGSAIPRVLASYLLSAPDRYASRIRPFELAALYDLPPLETLRFCLTATRAGYLHMRWDMRCPSCKGPKENSEHLNGVSEHAFCPSCSVDYTVGFDQNLELTFFPDPALRKVDEAHFCAGGPANTPHLPLQANFWPGDRRTLELRLQPGVYGFCCLSVGGELSFVVAEAGMTSLDIELAGNFPDQPLVLAPVVQLTVHNPKDYFQTLQLESLEWDAQVCSGALVSSLQDFRDFFSHEVLATETSLTVTSQTLLLASLSQDGPADESYLELIHEAIRDHDGAQVRSQAQTVLAAFQDPLDAVKASLSLFQQLTELNAFVLQDQPLELRISCHQGPCTVQNREGQLDYAGETLDVVSELLDLTQPGGLMITASVFADPELKWLLLRQNAKVLEVQLDLAEGEALTLYRIVPAEAAVGGLV